MLASAPEITELKKLALHRDPASVSIYLPSSPIPNEVPGVRIALKSAVADAVARLELDGIDASSRQSILDAIGDLDQDEDFWDHQSNSLVVLVAPRMLNAYRLASDVREAVVTSDRFEIGPLLRSISYPQCGYALTINARGARLFHLSPNRRPRELTLNGLPDDLHSVLEFTVNEGDADRAGAVGGSGQRIEHQKYCRLIQDAVIERIDGSDLPLILVATDDFEPAYRVVNTYPKLLETGIRLNPESVDPAALDARARELLEQHYREELEAWREDFGTKQAHGLGTSHLEEVAKAATFGAVDQLVFDQFARVEGYLDDDGIIHDDGSPSRSYNILDAIAVRVLEKGGIVRAVNPDDAGNLGPVSAMLRYSLANV
jgi:hypothetical protein